MKIKSHVKTRQLVAFEDSHLQAFLDKVQAFDPHSFRPTAASDPADPASDESDINDYFDDMVAAIYPPRAALQMDESRGLAIIPVVGVITMGLTVFEQRYFGCADVDLISTMIDTVAANPKINTVLFYFKTPGGYITGVEELTAKVARLTATPGKRTIGYANDICASAGYEIAAPCGSLFAAPSACIGSIGVKVTYVDYSAMAEKAGIVVRVFASGQYKAMGTPGTSLTKEQADYIQADIDREAGKFKALVQSMRPGVSNESMQGQCFTGIEALKANLVDGLVPDMATMLARL